MKEKLKLLKSSLIQEYILYKKCAHLKYIDLKDTKSSSNLSEKYNPETEKSKSKTEKSKSKTEKSKSKSNSSEHKNSKKSKKPAKKTNKTAKNKNSTYISFSE